MPVLTTDGYIEHHGERALAVVMLACLDAKHCFNFVTARALEAIACELVERGYDAEVSERLAAELSGSRVVSERHL